MTKKIKLSSSFIYIKIICLVGVIVTLKMISAQDLDYSAKSDLENKLLFVVLFALTIYFFTRPKIGFDKINLYIKRFAKKEIITPLENVNSVFYNPLGLVRGGYVYSIEYKGNSKDRKKIRFVLQYDFKERIKEFISLVKIHNPKVEII